MISNSAATHAKVAIYIRVSTLHQIDRDSLPMQRQDLIAYAKLILNTDDVTIFEKYYPARISENDVSASDRHVHSSPGLED